MKSINKNLQAGFTLVELMVVVAIIGILATIAIPQYARFQAKARQTEAKVALGGIYTAESSFAAEKSSFTVCISMIGYARDGNRFYYNSGFSTSPGNLCGPTGTSDCLATEWATVAPFGPVGTSCTPVAVIPGVVPPANGIWYQANTRDGPGAVPLTLAVASALSRSTFTAVSSGIILSATGRSDNWSISETKVLTNLLSGL